MWRHLSAMQRALAAELGVALGYLRAVRGESWVIGTLVLTAVGAWIWGGWRLPEATLPSPLETAEAFFAMLDDYRHDYTRAIGATLGVLMIGLGLACVVSLAMVLPMTLVPPIGRVLSPLLDLVGSVPNIALMPAIVSLMGLGDAPKITVVAIAATLPICINTYAALQQVDRSYEEVAMDLGASRLSAHLRVIWPLASPQIAAGLRIGVIQAITAVVVAEIYSAMTGLGGQLVGYSNSFRMARYLVIVLTLAVIGMSLTSALRLVERRLARRVRPGG